MTQCHECKGKGLIYRVIDCCERGCHYCRYEGVLINPKWRELRLKGEQNEDEEFPCRICSGQVMLGERIVKLGCGHEFHRWCCLQYMGLNKNECYICHQEDPYLDNQQLLQYVKEQELFRKDKEEKQLIDAIDNE